MGALRPPRLVAGRPVAPPLAPLAFCLGRVGGSVTSAQSRWASIPTLFQFLFPYLGWSTSSLPKPQKLSLDDFKIKVGVPVRVGCCGQSTRKVD